MRSLSYHDQVGIERTKPFVLSSAVRCSVFTGKIKQRVGHTFDFFCFSFVTSLVPSQKKIYQAILAEHDSDNTKGRSASNTSMAAFLNEGLEFGRFSKSNAIYVTKVIISV